MERYHSTSSLRQHELSLAIDSSHCETCLLVTGKRYGCRIGATGIFSFVREYFPNNTTSLTTTITYMASFQPLATQDFMISVV